MILVVDTSRKGIELALFGKDHQSLAKISNPASRGENLSGELTALLSQFQLKLSDIQKVLVLLGPGSFTGLRTGIAFCQGLCASGQRALYGISTLQAMQLQSPQASVLMYARPGFAYVRNENGKEAYLSNEDATKFMQNASQVLIWGFGESVPQGISALTIVEELDFSKCLTWLESAESSVVQWANYLQPSYAEQAKPQS